MCSESSASKGPRRDSAGKPAHSIWSARACSRFRVSPSGRRRTSLLAVPAVALCLFLVPVSLEARVYLSQPQALALAFPKGNTPVRETFFLTKAQLEEARKVGGLSPASELVIRYAGRVNGKPAGGWAYFETHNVRTLPETVMIVIGEDGNVKAVEILSFDEPPDYLPKRRWLDQLLGRKLNEELAIGRSVRPITGASLSGRAVVDATRRVLALHDVLSGVQPR